MSIESVLANERQWHVQGGDVFAGLAALPPASIHCIVSSPPYLGLRDYGIAPRQWDDGLVCCFGLEPDVASYVRHTVELFELFRRVLRDDGVIWWNLGDSYSSGTNAARKTSDAQHGRWSDDSDEGQKRFDGGGVPAGNKLLIPHRVAIALQDAGWIVRQDDVWAKRSPMPESISGWHWRRCRVKLRNGVESGPTKQGSHENRTVAGFNERYSGKGAAKYADCPGCDKCRDSGGWVLRRGSWRHTTAHEYLFQIVKSGEYFCDGQAALEGTTGNAHSRGNGLNPKARSIDAGDHHDRPKQNNGFSAAVHAVVESRNPRSVWILSSEPYKGAHFATFPSELVRRCLVASCSSAGCCPTCGRQWAPRVIKGRHATRPGTDSKVNGFRNSGRYLDHVAESSNHADVVGNRDPQRHVATSEVVGYAPTCDCPINHVCVPQSENAIPPIVLEPFVGSGTTIQVARWLGFRAIGWEVNENYLALAAERIGKEPRCARPKAKKLPKPDDRQRTLFEMLQAAVGVASIAGRGSP